MEKEEYERINDEKKERKMHDRNKNNSISNSFLFLYVVHIFYLISSSLIHLIFQYFNLYFRSCIFSISIVKMTNRRNKCHQTAEFTFKLRIIRIYDNFSYILQLSYKPPKF